MKYRVNKAISTGKVSGRKASAAQSADSYVKPFAVTPRAEPVSVSTWEEFESALDAGSSLITLKKKITMENTKIISGDVSIFGDAEIFLQKGPAFTGPLFEVPEGATLQLYAANLTGRSGASNDLPNFDAPLIVSAGTLIIQGSILRNNSNVSKGSTCRGGAISALKGSLDLVAVSITGNKTCGFGGGIFADEGVKITFEHVAIQHNEAAKGGGLYLGRNVEVVVKPNSIVSEKASLDISWNSADSGSGVYAVQDADDRIIPPNTWVHDNTCTKTYEAIKDDWESCGQINIEVLEAPIVCPECPGSRPPSPGRPPFPPPIWPPFPPPNWPGWPPFLPPTGCGNGYYTVTFDSTGGTPTPTFCVVPGGYCSYPTTPRRCCDLFHGWSTTENGSSMYDFSKPVEGDLTLYAVWINRPCP